MPWMPQPHEHSMDEVEGRWMEEVEEEGRWREEEGEEEERITRLLVIGIFKDITRVFKHPPDIHMRLRDLLSIVEVVEGK